MKSWTLIHSGRESHEKRGGTNPVKRQRDNASNFSAEFAEIADHKERRGRPARVEEEQKNLWLATGRFENPVLSARGRRDTVYYLLALEWLREQERMGEDFSVLLGTRQERRSPRFRPSKTLLIELYKIEEEEERLDAARRLCASPPLRPTIAAKEMRRERLGKPAGNTKELTARLLQVVNHYIDSKQTDLSLLTTALENLRQEVEAAQRQERKR
jgi:hypothetical protein